MDLAFVVLPVRRVRVRGETAHRLRDAAARSHASRAGYPFDSSAG